MAVGSITALGVFGETNGGKKSVLNQELIDQLKQVDEKAAINPLSNKITANQTKQTDLTAITTILNSFKTSVSSLTDSSSYLAKKVNSTGSNNANISVDNGVNAGDMSIKVNQLASKDSYQSRAFSMSNEPILGDLSGEASFNISIDGKTYTIEANRSTSLSDIAEQINEKTDGKINAKVLNVGGEEPYRLVFSSNQTGNSNKIDFSYANSTPEDTTNSEKLLNALGFFFEDGASSGDNLTLKAQDDLTDDQKKVAGSKLSSAADAKFEFNGIEVTRNTNTITDLQLGVTINLSKVDKEGEYTNFNIVQDTTAVASSIQDMITSYNTLVNNLQVATSYNSDTGASGTFQGVSEIINIKTSLNKIINGIDSNGKSLQDFGLSLNENGLLTLDNAKLKDKLENDFENFKSFFSSSTSYTNVMTSSSGIKDSADPISGTLKINDKEIDINLTGTTKAQRTKELLKAITNAGVTDITAKLNTDGNLVLQGIGGANLKIEGSDSLLENLGLSNVDLKGKTTTTTGFFEKLRGTLDNIVGKNGTLTNYSTSLIEENKKLSKDKEKAQEIINEKYERMQSQFSRYEVILNKLNNQLNTITSIIEQASKSN